MRAVAASFFLAFIAATAHAASMCETESAQLRRPLLELYTSQGCSSCPPADRWLAGLAPEVSAGRLSAVTWHVDYWDYLGWKDPLSMPEASVRQRWSARLANAVVYTPGVFLNGREHRAWQQSRLSAFQPGPTTISLKLVAERIGGELKIDARSQRATPDSNIVLVLVQLAHSNTAAKGENAGRKLDHQFSARALLSAPSGSPQPIQTNIPWPPYPAALVAWVQSPSGDVLQSAQLNLDECTQAR